MERKPVIEIIKAFYVVPSARVPSARINEKKTHLLSISAAKANSVDSYCPQSIPPHSMSFRRHDQLSRRRFERGLMDREYEALFPTSWDWG